jgi:peptidoglycan biosynthesis protein MviN/MurJ (putative lipid II flippase)
VNLVVAAGLVGYYRQAGLALANTLSAWLEVGLLTFALRKRLGRLEWHIVLTQLRALLGAGVVAGGVAWGLRMWWTDQFGHESFDMRLGEVFVPMAAASVVYLGLGLWLRVPFVKDLIAMVRLRVA